MGIYKAKYIHFFHFKHNQKFYFLLILLLICLLFLLWIVISFFSILNQIQRSTNHCHRWLLLLLWLWFHWYHNFFFFLPTSNLNLIYLETIDCHPELQITIMQLDSNLKAFWPVRFEGSIIVKVLIQWFYICKKYKIFLIAQSKHHFQSTNQNAIELIKHTRVIWYTMRIQFIRTLRFMSTMHVNKKHQQLTLKFADTYNKKTK